MAPQSANTETATSPASVEDSRTVATWVLYATVVTYSLSYSTFVLYHSGGDVHPVILYTVSLATLGCIVGAPLAMWRDTATVARQTTWEPNRVAYTLGSLLLGIPAIFILIYYLWVRRDKIREATVSDTSNAAVSPEDTG